MKPFNLTMLCLLKSPAWQAILSVQLCSVATTWGRRNARAGCLLAQITSRRRPTRPGSLAARRFWRPTIAGPRTASTTPLVYAYRLAAGSPLSKGVVENAQSKKTDNQLPGRWRQLVPRWRHPNEGITSATFTNVRCQIPWRLDNQTAAGELSAWQITWPHQA